jgi:hypothetical protein
VSTIRADDDRGDADRHTQISADDPCGEGKDQYPFDWDDTLIWSNLCQISPKMLQEQVNTHILPSLNEKKTWISMTWARKCLISMGYQQKHHAKGIYYDGHEHKDVVKRRREYINEVKDSAPYHHALLPYPCPYHLSL